MKLLLASRSEARRQMLEAAGLSFDLAETAADESRAKARLGPLPGRRLAEALAEEKAKNVAAPGPALVLGADQVLEREDGRLFDKPASREEALDQLRALSGRVHFLHSAAAAVENGETVWAATESAAMHVRPLSDDFLQAYLNAEYEQVRWNVGAYRIEGPGVQLFDRVDGSYWAILGFPLLPLLHFLRGRGILAT